MVKATAVLVTAVAVQAVVFSQAPARETMTNAAEAIPRVASLSELRARTPDERAAADFFNVGGGPLIPGTERQVISGPVLTSNAVWEELLFPPLDVSSLSPADAEAARDRRRRELEEWRKEQAESMFRDRVCGSAAVVVARPISRSLLLSTREDFLFMHYVATVERWIRPSRDSRTSVDITVGGGSALVGGQSVSASAGELKQLVLNESAVFYLVSLKDSAWYVSGTPARLNDPAQPNLVDRLSAAAAACQ